MIPISSIFIAFSHVLDYAVIRAVVIFQEFVKVVEVPLSRGFLSKLMPHCSAN